MRNIHVPVISSLEHVEYLSSPNAVCLVFEPSPLILLAELPIRRRRCRPFPGRSQSESTSRPRFDDLVGGRFIFLGDQSRQHLHLDTDRSRLYLETLNG